MITTLVQDMKLVQATERPTPTASAPQNTVRDGKSQRERTHSNHKRRRAGVAQISLKLKPVHSTSTGGLSGCEHADEGSGPGEWRFRMLERRNGRAAEGSQKGMTLRILAEPCSTWR